MCNFFLDLTPRVSKEPTPARSDRAVSKESTPVPQDRSNTSLNIDPPQNVPVNSLGQVPNQSFAIQQKTANTENEAPATGDSPQPAGDSSKLTTREDESAGDSASETLGFALPPAPDLHIDIRSVRSYAEHCFTCIC